MRTSPAIALVAALASCRHSEKEEAAPKVEVHCVSTHPEAIDETIALRGRIEPPPGGDLPVASQVSGRIVTVAVHEGQRIRRGDLVANVEDAPSRDAVRQAEAGLAQAESADVNAATTLDRAKAIVARGIAAKQDLDDAVTRSEQSRANVASARAAVDLARRTLGRVQVHSSFDGLVTRIWRGPGALVDGTAGTPIVQLAAATGVEFVADATDRDLARIAEGQAARGALSMGNAEFGGAVRVRSSTLDPATGLGTVRIAMDKADTSYPIGAFGRVVITVQHRDAVAILPTAALRGAVADGSEVALCRDGKAHLQTIKVGWRDASRFEPLEGVSPADKVATDHVLGLDNGTELLEVK
jgi:RND family efflux transporter MFP subunit